MGTDPAERAAKTHFGDPGASREVDVTRTSQVVMAEPGLEKCPFSEWPTTRPQSPRFSCLANSFQASLPVEDHRQWRCGGPVGERAHQESLTIVANFVAASNNEGVHGHRKKTLRLPDLKQSRA
jgi:hypothetical protein